MGTTFSRTTRSLDADSFRLAASGLILAALLLGGWLAWFFFAQVTRYEVSTAARLEVDSAVHPVAGTVAGRIVTTALVLGQDVETGQVLAELDAEPQRLQLAEERSRLVALPPQLAALHGEVGAEERALEEARGAARVALDEARAQFREGEAVARLAEQEARRAERLHAGGILSDVDLLRAQAEAQRRRAAAESLRLAVERLAGEQRTKESDRRAHIEELRSQITRLEGETKTVAVTIERLENEIEKRRIRAPVAGRVGEVANFRIGAVVAEGEKLGAVVPPGELRVVAEFVLSGAAGRIRPGQPARLRLEGFPWAQYGTVPATVSRVATEARDGRVRVELAVRPQPTSAIPLQHGLPGNVEVEVERIAPATLVLRAAGQLLARPVPVTDSAGGQKAER